jgi:hypothetical protein
MVSRAVRCRNPLPDLPKLRKFGTVRRRLSNELFQ